MLGAIRKGSVPSYQDGQRDVVYLVSHVEQATELPNWCFTDGHAVEAVTEFFPDLAHLNRVDWNAVQTWRWGGRWRLADPDITRRKQAEFLVHGRFPWTLFQSIGVLDTTMAAQVRAALADATHKPQVTVEPNRYYNL